MSIYAESSVGTDTNRINFNATTFPIFRVQNRRPQQRNIRDLDINIPFENGVSDFETLIGKVAYIIEGTMYPGGESQYDQGLAMLRKVASLEISQDDILSDDGYVPYQYSEFNQDKVIFVKVLYVDIVESTRKGLVQPFKMVCKVKDPTIYSADEFEASTSTATPSASTGTAIFPFTYPIVYGASTYSVTADANNTGDLPVYPVSITIVGPINSPKITNNATGEYIEVSVNLGSVSDQLVIVYDKDSLSVESNGVSVINQVTSASTFFKLQPGSNTITLTGSSISTGSYATLTYRSGWPLG